MTQLSDNARQEVALNLHKRDCQTCGAPLREQTPAVVIDDCGPFLSVTLNLQDCRPSGWYELRSVMVDAHLSWTSRTFTLPKDEGQRPPRGRCPSSVRTWRRCAWIRTAATAGA